MGNPNPSLAVNQNQKFCSAATSQIGFEGRRFGISRKKLDQPNHLSQTHILVILAFHFENFQIFCDLLERMAPSTKLEDKLEGIENFLAWKYIGLVSFLKRMAFKSTSRMKLQNQKKMKLRRSTRRT